MTFPKGSRFFETEVFESSVGSVQLTAFNGAAASSENIPVLTIRDLRRTFGTRLHENGFDDKTVADLLGHAGLRSVHRYKRGTEIKKRAILSLERPATPASISASPADIAHEDVAKLLKIMVEMRGIEPLTSALRTQNSGAIIH